MYDGECAAVFTYRDYAENVFFTDNPDVSKDDVKVIWSEPVPEAGISISTNLPKDVQDKLRETLLAINGTNLLADDRCPEDRVVTDAEGEEFCGAWPNKWWGLEEVDDTYWEPVEVVCRATDAPACAA